MGRRQQATHCSNNNSDNSNSSINLYIYMGYIGLRFGNGMGENIDRTVSGSEKEGFEV